MTFLQNNVDRRKNCMYTCLQIAFEAKINLVLFQEPWISSNNQFTISHSSFYCILPEDTQYRPRVVIYARKNSRFQVNIRSDLSTDGDFLVIDIRDQQNRLNTVQLVNIYNEKSLREDESRWTAQRCLLDYKPTKYTIITGDLNAHHP